MRGLEKECRELRQKNRELEQDADVARRFGRQPVPRPSANEEAVLSEVKDNAMVRSHIQSLNDTIGRWKLHDHYNNAIYCDLSFQVHLNLFLTLLLGSKPVSVLAIHSVFQRE